MLHPYRGTSVGPRVMTFDTPSFATIFKGGREEGSPILEDFGLSKYLDIPPLVPPNVSPLSAEVYPHNIKSAKRNWRMYTKS
jgi:hypothetical protein